jgi:hypothetical protein
MTSQLVETTIIVDGQLVSCIVAQSETAQHFIFFVLTNDEWQHFKTIASAQNIEDPLIYPYITSLIKEMFHGENADSRTFL